MENNFEDDLRTFLIKESQQQEVKRFINTKSEITNLIDVETVIKIFKELILINNPDEKFV